MGKPKKSILIQQQEPEDYLADFDETNQNTYKNNARMVALIDMVVVSIVMIDFIVLIVEEIVQSDETLVDEDWMFVGLTSGYVIFVFIDLILDIFLYKATKLTTERKQALVITKLWVWLNTFLQVLSLALIVMAFVDERKSMAGVTIAVFIVRIIFIIIVYRLVRWLEPEVRGIVESTLPALVVSPEPEFKTNDETNSIVVDHG